MNMNMNMNMNTNAYVAALRSMGSTAVYFAPLTLLPAVISAHLYHLRAGDMYWQWWFLAIMAIGLWVVAIGATGISTYRQQIESESDTEHTNT